MLLHHPAMEGKMGKDFQAAALRAQANALEEHASMAKTPLDVAKDYAKADDTGPKLGLSRSRRKRRNQQNNPGTISLYNAPGTICK